MKTACDENGEQNSSDGKDRTDKWSATNREEGACGSGEAANDDRHQDSNSSASDRTCFNCLGNFITASGYTRRYNLRVSCSESTIRKLLGYEKRPHNYVCLQCYRCIVDKHTIRYSRYIYKKGCSKRYINPQCVFRSLPRSEYTPNACQRRCRIVRKKGKRVWRRFCFNCGSDKDTGLTVLSISKVSIVDKVFGSVDRPHHYACDACIRILRHHTFDPGPKGYGQRLLNPDCGFNTLDPDEYTPRACNGLCGTQNRLDECRNGPVNDYIGYDTGLPTFRRNIDHNYTIDTTLCFVCKKEDSAFDALTIVSEHMIQEVFNIPEKKHDMICGKCAAILKTHVQKARASISAENRKKRLIDYARDEKYGKIIKAIGTQYWRKTLEAAGKIIIKELKALPLCDEVMTELCGVALQVIDKFEYDIPSVVTRSKLLLKHIFKPWLTDDKPLTTVNDDRLNRMAEDPSTIMSNGPATTVKTAADKKSSRMNHSRYDFKRHNPTKLYTENITSSGLLKRYQPPRRWVRPKCTPRSTGNKCISDNMHKSGNIGNPKLGNSKPSRDVQSTGTGTCKFRDHDKGFQERQLVHEMRTQSANLEPNTTEINIDKKIVQERLGKCSVDVPRSRSMSVDRMKVNRDSLRRTKTSIHPKHNYNPKLLTNISKYVSDISTITQDSALADDNTPPGDNSLNTIKNKSEVHYKDSASRFDSYDGSSICAQRPKSKRIAAREEQRGERNKLDDSPRCQDLKRTKSGVKHKSKRKRKSVLGSLKVENNWNSDFFLPVAKQKNNDASLVTDNNNNTNHSNVQNQLINSSSRIRDSPNSSTRIRDSPNSSTRIRDSPKCKEPKRTNVKPKSKLRRKNLDITYGVDSSWNTDVLLPISDGTDIASIDINMSDNKRINSSMRISHLQVPSVDNVVSISSIPGHVESKRKRKNVNVSLNTNNPWSTDLLFPVSKQRKIHASAVNNNDTNFSGDQNRVNISQIQLPSVDNVASVSPVPENYHILLTDNLLSGVELDVLSFPNELVQLLDQGFPSDLDVFNDKSDIATVCQNGNLE